MSINKNSQGLPRSLTAICPSDALVAGGLGVRFEVFGQCEAWPAFVVRHSQGLAAYINRCAHLALELDWNPGLFFDLDQRNLVCATHGALYTADTGECVGGPCNGRGLKSLEVVETEGIVYLSDSRYVGPHRDAEVRD